jgi:acyl-CoA thioesterase FadM
MLAVVLDDIMVNLAWHEKYRVVTGELTLRLKKPARVGEKLSLSAWISKVDSKIIYIESSAQDAHGEIVATAKASCVILRDKSHA